MKKYLIMTALPVLLFLLSACGKPVRKTFHLTGASEILLAWDGEYALFGIEANPEDAWTLTTDGDWFSVVQGFGNGDGSRGTGDATFSILCDRWTMNSTRTATITVTGPTGAFTKTLTQTPKPVPDEPFQLKGSVAWNGNEIRIELPAGYWVSAESRDAWLTVLGCREGELTVKADPNPAEDQSRETVVYIYLSDGTLLAEVAITQNAEKIPAPV